MKYRVAEKFKSVQGEGIYTGTPMAFIRFIGCSVGKKICQGCDTDFDEELKWRGGGEFTSSELLQWAYPYKHICLTGGEPLNQNLQDLVFDSVQKMIHIETSGTVDIPNLDWFSNKRHICVSPKPGFKESVIDQADEVKVIVPGLGKITPATVDARIRQIKGEGYQCGPGEFEDYAAAFRWPTIEDAVRWEAQGKIVFLQPRNEKLSVDAMNLKYVLDLLRDYPQLHLSCQLHKILKEQ